MTSHYERLRALVARLADRHHCRDAAEYIDFGEGELALDTLLDHLLEGECRLTDSELEEAAELSAAFGQNRLMVEALRETRRALAGQPSAVVFTLAYMDSPGTLRDFLAGRLGLLDQPSWDAFRGAIEGAAGLPPAIRLWGFEVFATRFARDAFHLLDCLLEASGVEVQLYTQDDALLDPFEERERLRPRS